MPGATTTRDANGKLRPGVLEDEESHKTKLKVRKKGGSSSNCGDSLGVMSSCGSSSSTSSFLEAQGGGKTKSES